MYNSQYYTCEQIDQRLLQGYLDDYNTENGTNLSKSQFLQKQASSIALGEYGVDSKPIAGSNNLVESGGVEVALNTAISQERDRADAALNTAISQERDRADAALNTAISQERDRADAAFSKLSLEDTTDLDVQATELHVGLNKNDGSEENPDIRILDTLVIPSATTEKAGLMSANDKATLASSKTIVGYYICDTAAATAAKVVEASNYVLTVGGSMKVKMTNANTANNATLNINSTGAKALYYAGERASANNSWEAGETVEVYYDGTSYYANNIAGGSGSGDGAFDISAKTGNTYETLSAALTAANTILSASKKKGGMSIKFIQLTPATYSVVKTEGLTEQPTGTEVQEALAITDGTYTAAQLPVEAPATTATYWMAVSGDTTTYTTWGITKVTSDSTKYVQYRLMRTDWSTIEYNWSSVDDEIERQELIAKTKVSSKALSLSEAGGRTAVSKNLRMNNKGVIGSGGNVGRITYTGLLPKGTVVHLTGTMELSSSDILYAYVGFMVEDPNSFDSLLGVKANDLISIALKKGYPVDIYFEVPYDSYLIISRNTNQLDVDSVKVFKPVELPAIDDEPIAESNNLVKSGGVFAQIKEVQDSISNTAVFDISKWNAEDGVSKTYSSLANALAGSNVPTDVRQPGMSIKFILLTPDTYTVVKTEGINVDTPPTGTEIESALAFDSGTYTAAQLGDITLPTSVGGKITYWLFVDETIDNPSSYTTWEITYDSAEVQEYVQYRLMSTSYNTTVSNWQGVDKAPVYNSPNLITSGAVEEVINDRVCFKDIFAFTNKYDINRGTGAIYSASDRVATVPYYLVEPYNIDGYIVLANDVSALLGSICIAFYSTNATSGFLGTSGLVRTTKIPIVEGAKYIRVSLTNIPSGNKSNANLDNLFLYKNNVLGNIGGDIEKLNASIQDINTNITTITEEIAEINSDSVYNLNKDKHEVIFSAKCQEHHYSTTPNNAMVAFLVMTDIHTDKGRFNRGLAYANDESLIDEVLVLGDVCDAPAELRSWNYGADVLTCNKPVLTIPGNHEVASVGSGPFTNQEFMDKFYTPTLIEKNGDIHGENETWWYKDVSHEYTTTGGSVLSKTIRVIGINQVDYCTAIDKNTWYLSQAQIDWFVNLLDTTPDEDYYVLVISHVAFDSDFTPVDCKFTGPKAASTFPALADKSFITNIIRAWINGSTVQATTTNSADNLEVSVNHTFANAHTNKFIGILAGHSHRDFVGRVNGDEAIYQFSLHCTTSNTHQQSGDLGRTGGTGRTGDCLTVFVYDWFKHRVKLIRIGADITTGMTRRDFDAIDLVSLSQEGEG